MKSNKNKKLIAIILPAFLVTSVIEPAFAAELIMGTNGQVQSVVSAEQTQAESSLPTEQVPEDLFESAGALSAPTPEDDNIAAAIPEGWSAVASNSNFAFKVDNQIDAVTHNNVWTLKLLNLGTSEEKVVNVQNGWPSDPFGTDVDVSPDASTVIYKVSYGSAVNKVVLQNIANSALKLELEGQRVDPILYSDTAVHIVVKRTVRYGSPVQVYTGVTLSDLKIYNTKYLFINPGSDVRVDNDRPYVTQLVRNSYSNTWTLYVYRAPDGTNNWLNLIHSQTLYTGQAGGSSTLTHLDVTQNANGYDILNLSIDSTQTDVNLNLNLTLLSVKLPSGLVLPGQLVDFTEDDRVGAYVYLDANGKRQAVIYDKLKGSVVSAGVQRVQVNAGEYVLFFNVPAHNYALPKGYLLHIKNDSAKLSVSNLNASQIQITPGKDKIIFITVSANGNASFGIYQLGSKTLYLDSIHHWGLGAKMIWTDPNNQMAAVSVGNDEKILFISLSTANRQAFVPATSIYNRVYDVVAIPGVVRGRIATLNFNFNAQTIQAVTTGGDHLLFNMTANGSVWLRQIESWQRYGNNVIREYTKIIFGADGKRNNMWLKQYNANGQITYEQEVIYEANGNVKRIIAYRYTMIRGRIVKVAV